MEALAVLGIFIILALITLMVHTIIDNVTKYKQDKLNKKYDMENRYYNLEVEKFNYEKNKPTVNHQDEYAEYIQQLNYRKAVANNEYTE